MALGAAERRLQILARLAHGMVHEAKNPLNAMAIRLGALGGKFRSSLPESAQGELDRHLTSLEDQLRRVDGIVSRFGAQVAGIPNGIAHTDVGKVVREVAALCEFDARRLRLRLEVSGPESFLCQLDRVVLEQHLVELFLEALDACAGMAGNLTSSRTAVGADLSVVLETADPHIRLTFPKLPELPPGLAQFVQRRSRRKPVLHVSVDPRGLAVRWPQ